MAEIILLGLLFHFIGDYLTQSDWMADKKVQGSAAPGESWLAAITHGVVYTLPFLFLTTNIWALLIIGGTHVIIDHYRLARHVVFAKNFIAPRRYWPSWEDSKKTGYPSSKPDWLTVWLMIIADNVLHVVINSITLIGFM